MAQDHVYTLVQIPPKYAVSEVVDYTNGKDAIAVARVQSRRKKNSNGESFWVGVMRYSPCILRSLKLGGVHPKPRTFGSTRL
jgi:REP element-mobilizing transposase RayT